MKKAKIMLLAVAIVAIAGGALAFNTKFGVQVCTIATEGGVCPERACPNPPVLLAEPEANVAGNICYSTLPEEESCDQQLCIVTGFTEQED